MYLLLTIHAKSKLVSRKTYIISMDMTFMPKAFANDHNWYSSTIHSLKTTNHASSEYDESSPSLLYGYDQAIHGFAALLSQDELEAL